MADTFLQGLFVGYLISWKILNLSLSLNEIYKYFDNIFHTVLGLIKG